MEQLHISDPVIIRLRLPTGELADAEATELEIHDDPQGGLISFRAVRTGKRQVLRFHLVWAIEEKSEVVVAKGSDLRS
jgi:hypothetical protein